MKTEPSPSVELHREIRARLVAEGSNLSLWCKQNRINYQTCVHALKGTRNGNKSRSLRLRVVREVMSK